MLDASKYLDRILVERYHIKKEIGRGASSIVFYAEDMITKDESGSPLAVAIKILDKDSNEYKINSKSFYIETRAVVGMPVNAHTVAVKDVSYDPENDVRFIVMEYVKGTTLRRYMASRGAFSAREIVSVGLQVLEALRVAHEAKVVHRDVKPQNILVQDSAASGSVVDSLPGGKNMPYVKLADFGIALLPDEDPLKMKDRGVGSVHYISPEQASGDKVDARSDLYSLGVVLYELATGKVPFDAESATAVISKHQVAAPTHVRAINSSIPLLLDQIIFRAMQKDPAKRFKDAASMEKYLKEVLMELDGLPVSVAGEIPEYKEPFFRNKKQIAMFSVAVGAVAICIGVAIFLSVMIPKWVRDSQGVTVVVPTFVGEVYDKNEKLPDGISVVVKKEYSDEVPEGVVISQSHGAGLEIKGSLTVTVTVSLGAEPVAFDLPLRHRDSFEAATKYITSLWKEDSKKVFRVDPDPIVLPYDEAKGDIGAVIGIKDENGADLSFTGATLKKGSTVRLVTNGWGEYFEIPESERRDSGAVNVDTFQLSYEKAKAYIEREYGGKITVDGYALGAEVKREDGSSFLDSSVPLYNVVGAMDAKTGALIDIDGDQVHVPEGGSLHIKLIINSY